MLLPTELLLLTTLSTLCAATPPRYTSHHNSQPLVQNLRALASYGNNLKSGSSSAFTYKCYHGDINNYPAADEWLSFDALWDINREQILSANGGDTYVQHYIHEGILEVAKESKVSARLILATALQESGGKAATPCTETSPKCGMLQAAYSSSSFKSDDARASILAMLREGVTGTSAGGPYDMGAPGLAQYLDGDLPWVQGLVPGNPYAAVRAYDSGSVGGNLDDVSAGTANYVNDVANRLLGWNGVGRGFGACV